MSNEQQTAEPAALQLNDGLGAGAEARRSWESEMLAMLSHRFGTTTCDLAQRHSKLMLYGHNQHQRSAAALAMLRTLEAEGKVRKMDDQKPIAWMLVAPNGQGNGQAAPQRGEGANDGNT